MNNVKVIFGIFILFFVFSCSEDKKETCVEHKDCQNSELCLWDVKDVNYQCQNSCTKDADCGTGLVCEQLEGSALKGCFQPIKVKGKILNNDTDAFIEGAYVTLFRTDDTFISNTMITNALGEYEVMIPTIRNSKGEMLPSEKDYIYQLRVQALSYQKYPSFIRVAIPFQVESITNGYYQSVLTTVKLFPITESDLYKVSGKISEKLAGVLVTAEHKADKTLSTFAYTDVQGNFNLVNLKAGDYQVVAYKYGVNFSKEEVHIQNQHIENIVLTKEDESTSKLGSIQGSVQIVDGGTGSGTSIVVVPEATFHELWKKGEMVPGLRAPESGVTPNITGNYTIENIPEGNYVILAAFENDDLVQDPDTNIAGTSIVHFSIPSENNYNLQIESFKITGALKLVSPGGESIEEIENLIQFQWEDDSSEDGYIVELFDSLGNKVFEKTVGKSITELAYDGEPLKKGYYYQWKVTSFREKTGERSFISKSEDLRGIFYIADDMIQE